MKKTFLIITLMWLALSPMRAAEGVKYLVVTLKDASEASFALAEKPVVSYASNVLNVVAGDENVDFNVADVEKFTFSENITTGLKDIVKGGAMIAGRQAAFNGLKPGTRINVVTTSGQTVQTVVAEADGTCLVDLSQLPKGIYIIATPTASFKVTTK